MLTTFMYGYLQGVFGDILATSAKLETGHVKIMTKDYAEISKQIPNDFAIQKLTEVTKDLEKEYDITWVPRIRFGGLLDIPDEKGETRSQGPIMGIGIKLLSPQSGEIERFDLNNVIIEGRQQTPPLPVQRLQPSAGDCPVPRGSHVVYLFVYLPECSQLSSPKDIL